MAFPAWLPFVGPVLQGLGSYLESRQSRENVADTIEAQKELADLAWQRQQEMIRMQNEYNTPFEQMKRYQDAGLNPNLIYSRGQPGLQTRIAEYQAPNVDYSGRRPFNPSGMMGSFFDTMLRQAQVDNLEANAVNARANAAATLVKRSGHLTDNKKKELEYGIAKELEQYTVKSGKTELEYLKQRLSNAQKDGIMKDFKNEIKERTKEWEKFGISPRDKLWLKGMMNMFSSLGMDISWIRNIIDDKFFN